MRSRLLRASHRQQSGMDGNAFLFAFSLPRSPVGSSVQNNNKAHFLLRLFSGLSRLLGHNSRSLIAFAAWRYRPARRDHDARAKAINRVTFHSATLARPINAGDADENCGGGENDEGFRFRIRGTRARLRISSWNDGISVISGFSTCFLVADFRQPPRFGFPISGLATAAAFDDLF